MNLVKPELAKVGGCDSEREESSLDKLDAMELSLVGGGFADVVFG